MDNANWDYGGYHRKYDMRGEISLPNNSTVAVCDWTVAMPEFMHAADTLFIDPPWNIGNAKSFYTKARQRLPELDFLRYSDVLFARIDEIAPRFLFIEMGKEFLHYYLQKCKERWKYVTFYNSTYYKNKKNKCYVIHACNEYKRRRYPDLEDLDEADIIKWVCHHHSYACIGDLCMGRGLVGQHAYAAGKPFVGTELNPARLAVLVNHIMEATSHE